METIMVNGKEIKKKKQIDFIDIGCSKGGSYKHIKKKFNFTSGLGIDLDETKVFQSLQNNIPALVLDATNLSIFTDNACKLISIMHVLEHLPNIKVIEDVIKESIRVASDKIYIRGPTFYDNYLKEKGFRFFWSHWTGHTCHVEPDDIIKILKKYNISNYELNYLRQVEDSSDTTIQPFNCDIDRFDYDPEIDPPKEMGIKLENIYKEFEITIFLQEMDLLETNE